VKVSSSFNQGFVDYLKSIGGRWDPEARCWDVPDQYREQVMAKARELGVQNLRIEQETPQPQTSQQPASLPRPLGEIVREAPIREAPVKEGAAARRRSGEGERREGAIRMRMSRDGRFILISIDLLAFTNDVKEMLAGKRRSVRFRVLPPRES